MSDRLLGRYHRLALIVVVSGTLLLPRLAPAQAAEAPVTQVRFQLRSDCSCASCGFALSDQLRKQPGVVRVSLSTRDRTVTIAFEEQRIALSRVAAALAASELGKRSLLIGDMLDPSAAAVAGTRARFPGVRTAAVDRKGRLLLELAPESTFTTAELTTLLAKAGVPARIESSTAGARRP